MNRLAQPVVLLSVLCVSLFTLEVVSGLGQAVYKHPAALHTRAEGEQQFGKCTLDYVKTLFLDYPRQCSEALRDVEAAFKNGGATINDLTKLYETACQDACIKPVKEFRSICEEEKSIKLILSSCSSVISSGDICVLSLLKNDGITAAEECDKAVDAQTCSQGCHDSLLKLKQDSGCCVNSLFNVTTYGYDSLKLGEYKLWSLCDVTPPPFCNADSIPFGSKSSIPSASFITVLVLLIMVYFL